MCLCTWPINFIWDEFWVWEDQNWSVWEKGFWNSKFFCRLMSVRLSVRQANLKRTRPVHFGRSSLERTVSEHKCRFCQGFAWANRERAPSEHAQNATETWSLKRTSLRLSELHPVQPHLIFRFVYLGTKPNFLNGFFWFI